MSERDCKFALNINVRNNLLSNAEDNSIHHINMVSYLYYNLVNTS